MIGSVRSGKIPGGSGRVGKGGVGGMKLEIGGLIFLMVRVLG